MNAAQPASSTSPRREAQSAAPQVPKRGQPHRRCRSAVSRTAGAEAQSAAPQVPKRSQPHRRCRSAVSRTAGAAVKRPLPKYFLTPSFQTQNSFPKFADEFPEPAILDLTRAWDSNRCPMPFPLQEQHHGSEKSRSKRSADDLQLTIPPISQNAQPCIPVAAPRANPPPAQMRLAPLQVENYIFSCIPVRPGPQLSQRARLCRLKRGQPFSFRAPTAIMASRFMDSECRQMAFASPARTIVPIPSAHYDRPALACASLHSRSS